MKQQTKGDKMTENFTQEELSLIQNDERALKTAATVVLKNSQTLDILNAKVDTLGVTTVRQAKDNVSTLEIVKQNKETIDTLYQNQQESNKSLGHVELVIDEMLDMDTKNSLTIDEIRKTVVELSETVEESKNQIVSDINTTTEAKKKHMADISSSLKQIDDELKRIDYKTELDKINESLSVLASNVSIYRTKSEENYDALYKQVQILELATANTVSTARTYQEGLVTLNNQVSNLLNRVTHIESQVSTIKLKPSLSSHDEILKMFNDWEEPITDGLEAEVTDTWTTGYDRPEEVTETTETETTVTVDVDYEAVEPEVETVEEPVIEEKPKKKGFFGFFK